jgi:hypothetical protein
LTGHDPDGLEVAEILREASALIGAHPLAFVLATAIYVMFGIWIEDQDASGSAQVTMAVVPVVLQGFLQYLLLRQAFADSARGGAVRLLAPFIVIMLQLGLWTILGLGYLLLLVPGLYLAARTSAALGMATVEGTGLFASLAGSWHRTRRAVWPLAMVHAILLFPVVALLVGLAVATAVEYHLTYESIEFTVFANLGFGVITMAGWAVAGAAYRLTLPSHRMHEDVFG